MILFTTRFQVFRYVRRISTNDLKYVHIYRKYIEIVETLKTSIHTTNHTQNTKSHFRNSLFSKSILLKLGIQHKSAFHVEAYGTNDIVACHTI